METLKQLEDGDPTKLNNITGCTPSCCGRQPPRVRTLTSSLPLLMTIFWATAIRPGHDLLLRLPIPSLRRSPIVPGAICPRRNQRPGRGSRKRSAAGSRDQRHQHLHPADRRRLARRLRQDRRHLPGAARRERAGAQRSQFSRKSATDSPLSGIAVEVQKMEQGPPVGKPIQIQFSSYSRDLLEPAVARVRELHGHDSRAARLDDTRSLPGIEWQLSRRPGTGSPVRR